MEVEQQGVPDGWSVVDTTPKPSSNFATLRTEMLAGGERGKRGAEAYGRLSPDERKAFGEFVRGGLAKGELQRADEPIASGVPIVGSVTPEMALGVGAGVRAVAASARAAGGGAVAAGKATMANASPILKYEATHQILKHLGVPESLAIPAAMAVSGYRRGGTAARVPSAPAEPVPAPPAAAPTAMGAKRGQSGLGESPLELTRRLRAEHQAAAAPAPTPTTPMATAPSVSSADLGQALKDLASKGHLTPAELNQALKWVKAGMSQEHIISNIERSRQLGRAFNTPTPDEVAARVAARNATGKWE